MNTYSEAKKNTHFVLSSSVLLSLRGTRKCDGKLPVSCALLRASASHHCVLRSNPRLRIIFGLRLLFFSLLASRIICSTSPLSSLRKKIAWELVCYFLCEPDSYSEAEAKYKWKRGRVKSVERSPDISLPQMDLVEIRASEDINIYSTGKSIK